MADEQPKTVADTSKFCRLVSDGTAGGTKLLMPDGSKITGIKSITWRVGVDQRVAVVTVEMLAVQADVSGVLNVIEEYAKQMSDAAGNQKE